MKYEGDCPLGLGPPRLAVAPQRVAIIEHDFLQRARCGDLLGAIYEDDRGPDGGFIDGLVARATTALVMSGQKEQEVSPVLLRFIGANRHDLHAVARLLAKIEQRRTRA